MAVACVASRSQLGPGGSPTPSYVACSDTQRGRESGGGVIPRTLSGAWSFSTQFSSAVSMLKVFRPRAASNATPGDHEQPGEAARVPDLTFAHCAGPLVDATLA